jgi:Polyketide cyclase / dehydrase and lipid transport
VTTLEITARVLLRAEPARVWRAAMDWPGQGDWMLATRVRGGQGVGAEVVARTGVGPVGVTDTMVITQWDPPRRCIVRHTGRVLRGTGVFEVVPRGAASEFAWTERLQVPRHVPRLARRLAAGGGRWVMGASLRRFARLIRDRP